MAAFGLGTRKKPIYDSRVGVRCEGHIVVEREHFGAVVIGSGSGGSVTAYVLASAGIDACLLERGKSYPPGSVGPKPSFTIAAIARRAACHLASA
jgi:ribulose 1,5-bisphosphate synthetase/thiazole synthase